MYDKEKAKKRYEVNREKLLAYSREYYEKKKENIKKWKKEYYQTHKEEYNARERRYSKLNPQRRKLKRKRKHELLKKKFKEWRETNPSSKVCCQCGEDNILALQFHHIDKNQKKFGIREAINKNRSWKTIQEEIKKCIVLCANCHQILHSTRL